MDQLLRDAAKRAAAYLHSLEDRRVAPTAADVARLRQLAGQLPDAPLPPEQVLERLDTLGSPATVASAGGRYFGFVTGGALPAAVAAASLTAAWDQNSALSVMSPLAVQLEAVALGWIRDLLGLGSDAHGFFVTGTTMGNFTALAAARHAVLTRAGWDVEAQGLFGAPPIQIVVGAEAHVALYKALGMLGLGRERVQVVPVDDQGRMRADKLPELAAPCIICTQAGNVNTGAIDPLGPICQAAAEARAWVHVDGAFGIWAAAAPSTAPLIDLADGLERIDSCATDGHKWLNLPYDCGIVFLRDVHALGAAMANQAAYLPMEGTREPIHFTPEGSRRARGIEAWAGLLSLGRTGVAEIIERCCALARRFADGLDAAGFEVLNEVSLNQVLVSFGDDALTRRVIQAVQQDGTCWCGGSEWRGRSLMRISVSSWATTEADVDRSLAAITRIAKEMR